MVNHPSTIALFGALVSAGAYAQAVPATVAAPIPTQAVQNIQRARVDIYCGHDQQAVAEIRLASRQLQASGAAASAEVLAALDEAAWLTRRRRHVLAEESLQSALNRIAVDRESA